MIADVWKRVVDVLYWPRRLFYRLERIWAYLPILWRDHDWDHSYILRLLAFKLRRVQKALAKGHHANREQEARRVQICAELLERIVASDYLTNEMWAHKIELAPLRWKPYGDPKDDLMELINTPDPGFREASLRSDAREKADWAMFLKIFGRHLFSWWD